MYFKKYIYGDTAVYFIETPVEGEKRTTVGMAVYPADVEPDVKKLKFDSLVQVAFAGDETLVDYTRGVTMRNRSSTVLKVVKQVEFVSGKLNTYLTDGAGNDYIHSLFFDRATGVFTVSVRYENHTGAPRMLEHLSSFSLSGIAAPETWDMGGLSLVRMTSAWSRECRLRRDAFPDLGLDPSWARYGVKVERFGEVGSMANRGYFPFAAIEDRASGTVWGCMLEAPGAWQMEVYAEKEMCAFSGGLADFETGHWRKLIPAGESFETRSARFCVSKRGLLDVCNALVHEQDARLVVPASEDEMPVLYNEYCATWGTPTAAKVEKQLAAATALGLKYFVIDAGWFKPLDKGWTNAGGDWQVNPEYFPDIKETVALIRSKGMKAGIWFEYEVAGRESELFGVEQALLHRDGMILTSKNRRFLDLRMPEAQAYLKSRLIDFLRTNGFSYLKIDYNDSIGIGCDGAESVGEGGRQVAEASIAMLDRIRDEIPGIILENCASGGSRIEPLRMSKVSMCSFSDAHECPEIPLVAANVTRVVPARQVQIWAAIRKNESDARTVYSLCAAMMGRICLSGDINVRQKEKLARIHEGLEFYRAVKEIVRRGDIVCIDCDIASYRAPKGRQIYMKAYGRRLLVIVHRLESEDAIDVSAEGYTLTGAYTTFSYTEEAGMLKIAAGEPCSAGAFLFERG